MRGSEVWFTDVSEVFVASNNTAMSFYSYLHISVPFTGWWCVHLAQRNVGCATQRLSSQTEQLIFSCNWALSPLQFIEIRKYQTKYKLFSVPPPTSDLQTNWEVFIWNKHHRPDDGSSKRIWNVCELVPDYTVQKPRTRPLLYSLPAEISKLTFSLLTYHFFPCIVAYPHTTGTLTHLQTFGQSKCVSPSIYHVTWSQILPAWALMLTDYRKPGQYHRKTADYTWTTTNVIQCKIL
jgi:hypothetical protein